MLWLVLALRSLVGHRHAGDTETLQGPDDRVAHRGAGHARRLLHGQPQGFGELRADAKPTSPGIVVYATHPRQGDLRFACDTYQRWWHNVRAVAKTLEALRGIARWGAVRDEQQFAGFRALPGATTLTMGVSAATKIIETESGTAAPNPVTAEWVREAGRRAKASTHPDVTKDRVRWDAVESALRVLGGAS